MSDAPQGPGWWQASDGKWYAPEQQTVQPAASAGWTGGGGGGGYGPATLDVTDAIKFGWESLKRYFGQLAILLAAIFLSMLLVMVVFAVLIVPLADHPVLQMITMTIGYTLALVVAFIISKGLIEAVLVICDGQEPDLGRVFNFENIGPYVLTALLFGVVVMVGSILCIIPGIIANVALQFWPYAVVDEDKGPVDALKASWELVSTRTGEVLIFLLGMWALNLVGALLCGLGLIVTIPITMIATGYAWRVLRGRPPVLR